MEKTEKLGLNLPEKGYKDWDIPINENFEILDSKTLQERNITNCITEIPQDIKLELNDGTLTLKAGSKFYVPNGFEADGVTPKFDVVVINSDLIGTTGDEADYMYCISSDAILSATYTQRYFSGSTAPSSPAAGSTWFDTSTNLVKRYRDNAWVSGYSFPVCIARTSGIKQVFNGFGYIGSTVFALPGVKGLIPNGRNADGSLKNIEFVVDNVLTTTTSNSYTDYPLIIGDGGFGPYVPKRCEYKEDINRNYNNDSNVFVNSFVLGYASSDGKVTSFIPKTAFHAIDRNDSSWIAQQAMPSDKYIDLTLGASGSSYTAPANGYFAISKPAGGTGQFHALSNVTAHMSIAGIPNFVGAGAEVFIPAKRNDKIKVNYTTTGTATFRFIYAEGEN